VLNAISVDKTVVDVSNGSQTFTFSIDAFDASGISSSYFYLRTPGNDLIKIWNQEDPNIFTFTADSNNTTGIYEIDGLYLYDIHNNETYVHKNQLLDFGLNPYIEVIGITDSEAPIINTVSVDQTVVDVSSGEQIVTFSVNATDESGINWSAGPNRTNVVLKSPSSGVKWATGTNDNPEELSVSFNQDDEGAWTILWVEITDIYGNLVRNHDVSSIGLPSYIYIDNGLYSETTPEFNPPILDSVSLDQAEVDVSLGAQIVTFSVDVTDESGINWSAGPNRTNVIFDSPISGYKYATGSNDNPGELSVSFNQGDEGAWTIMRVEITDIYGNLVRRSDTGYLGLPSHIEVIQNQFNFDFDNNGSLDALTDGLLLLRYAFGLRGENLTNAAIGLDSTLTTEEIEGNIEQALDIADIDNDGTVSALTDGLLLLRYFFGLRGEILVNDVVSLEATRTSASEIEAYIESYIP
jgi:hypothetical protein